MGWLDRIRKGISDVLERVSERLRPTIEDYEEERREREEVVEHREERVELTVWPMEHLELRPFSSVIQYSERTKVRRDLVTGRFTSKEDYKFLLRMWRQETAGEYIRMAHPLWTERELTEAVMRIEELRSKPSTSWMDDIEIGAIFTPI